MFIIGYHKANQYIITIETDTYKTYLDIDDIVDINNCLYETNNFSVLKIEDLMGNTYESVLDFIVNEDYNYINHSLEFFKIRENAFYLDFIFKKQWNLFPDGYSGNYKEILKNGTIVLEYFHINGIKNGYYKLYYNNKLTKTYFYFNDIKII